MVGDKGRTYSLFSKTSNASGHNFYAISEDGLKFFIKSYESEQQREQLARETCMNYGPLKIIDNPNILRAVDRNREEDPLFLVYDFQSGKDLSKRIEDTPFELEEALETIRPICDALQACHEFGLVHGDVKPRNVLLTASGPKLIDFGIAKGIGERLKDKDILLGTPEYISPEQAPGSAIWLPQGDVYSLGITLFEMLSGRPPYPVPPSKHFRVKKRYITALRHGDLKEAIPSVREYNPLIPSPVAQVIAHATEKDRSKRTSSAKQLASELEKAVLESKPSRHFGGRLPILR